MVRRSRRGGVEPPVPAPAAPSPPAPTTRADVDAAAANGGPFSFAAFNQDAPPGKSQLQKDAEEEGLIGKGRRTRRRHRTRKSRRRGGYTEKSHKRHRVLKALTRHWRNKQQSHEVLSRANERGMEMLRRQAALRAKYSA